jgi:signal transduction histidine kinase
MLVDDGITNLELLKAVLGSQNYDLRAFLDGPTALAAAEREPPDLILLDISMPLMNGYDVCERLKANPALAGIPVIFSSALTATSDKVAAFACGGVDYIPKPIQPGEVKARVRAQLQLFHHQRDLSEKLDRIRRLEEMRDSLTHMIAHDMRTPIGSIAVALELLQQQLPALDEPGRRTLDIVEQNAAILMRLVDQMLDISRMESGQMPLHLDRFNLPDEIQQTIQSIAQWEAPGRVVLKLNQPVDVVADCEIIQRVVANLVENALKFSRAGQQVTLTVTGEDGRARVAVTDQSEGISAADRGKIFDKFVQLANPQRKTGTGLGLAFCKLAVEAHGGTIGVDSEPGQGSTFWFELPLAAGFSRSAAL